MNIVSRFSAVTFVALMVTSGGAQLRGAAAALGGVNGAAAWAARGIGGTLAGRQVSITIDNETPAGKVVAAGFGLLTWGGVAVSTLDAKTLQSIVKNEDGARINLALNTGKFVVSSAVTLALSLRFQKTSLMPDWLKRRVGMEVVTMGAMKDIANASGTSAANANLTDEIRAKRAKAAQDLLKQS